MNPTKARRPQRQPQEGKHRCKPCDKVAFPTEDKGYAAALRLSRIVGPIRVYPCPEDNGFHLSGLYNRLTRPYNGL